MLNVDGKAQRLQLKQQKRDQKELLDACKSVKREAKKVKSPAKAATAYRMMMGSQDVANKLALDHPNVTDIQMTKLRRDFWNSLGSEGQRPYKESAEMDKLRYAAEVDAYLEFQAAAASAMDTEITAPADELSPKTVVAGLLAPIVQLMAMNTFKQRIKLLKKRCCLSSRPTFVTLPLALSEGTCTLIEPDLQPVRSFIADATDEEAAVTTLSSAIDREVLLRSYAKRKGFKLDEAILPYVPQYLSFVFTAKRATEAPLAAICGVIGKYTAFEQGTVAEWHKSVQTEYNRSRRTRLKAGFQEHCQSHPCKTIPYLELPMNTLKVACCQKSMPLRALEVLRLIDLQPGLRVRPTYSNTGSAQALHKPSSLDVCCSHLDMFENSSPDLHIVKDIISYVASGGKKVLSSGAEFDLRYISAGEGSAADDISLMQPMIDRERKLETERARQLARNHNSNNETVAEAFLSYSHMSRELRQFVIDGRPGSDAEISLAQMLDNTLKMVDCEVTAVQLWPDYMSIAWKGSSTVQRNKWRQGRPEANSMGSFSELFSKLPDILSSLLDPNSSYGTFQALYHYTI